MKHLIWFSLNRRFLNKMTLLLNIVLFLACGFLLHIDKLVEEKPELETVLLDSSTDFLNKELISIYQENFRYRISNEGYREGECILHYENGWFLYSKEDVAESLKAAIRNDINTALLRQMKDGAEEEQIMKIRNYEKLQATEIEVISEKKENPLWLITTVIYFLLVSYGGLLANEMVYEKATNTLKLILSSVSASAHLFSKIITGYLSMFIQFAMAFFWAVFWVVIRVREDNMAGLFRWLETSFFTEETKHITGITLNAEVFGFSLLSILLGILTVQIFMLVITSSFSSSQQASAFQGPLYLFLIVGYYLLMIYGNEEFFLTPVSRVLSFVPVGSMLFMPCRLFAGDALFWEAISSLALAAVFLITVTILLIPVYKNNLQNEPQNLFKPLKFSMKKASR
ncbi:MAG: ABC transporter permease [Erysipelotrichaceae bacterium]|nr:ABC transporter permease [Erysipelotrichaceae bacterium]